MAWAPSPWWRLDASASRSPRSTDAVNALNTLHLQSLADGRARECRAAFFAAPVAGSGCCGEGTVVQSDPGRRP